MDHVEDQPECQLQQMLQQLVAVSRVQFPHKFRAHFQPGKKKIGCSMEDFAIYFLAAVRQHTDLHFRSSASNESETPKCQTPQHKPTKPLAAVDRELLNESQSLGNMSIGSVSTPVRQATPHLHHQQQQQHHAGRRSGGSQFCSTPQSNERGSNRSSGAGVGGGSFCLGDFLLNTTPNQSHQRSKKKVTPQSSHTAPQENANSSNNKSQKPRRRVLPMTISKNVSASSSFGDTSSFSNENNLLRLSQSCELDRSQGAALEQEARKTLLLRKQEIKSEAPVPCVELDREQDAQRSAEPDPAISLDDVSNAKQLRVLAAIYAHLMDLNLVPNVLSELSYATQLLNIRAVDAESPESEQAAPLSLLSRQKECIFFAVQVLEFQEALLLQLDRKSLAVLLQHERLRLLPKKLQEELDATYQRKQQQCKGEGTPVGAPDSQQNVYYQHDKDSRENFPSQHEFGAFKTQRDLFYKALKHWEVAHLNRMFSFSQELEPRVQEIFKQSEHAVNMAHLAKLFVSQLLMSSGETHESPEELGLKLDQQRLNRLAQRLVTSNSSVEDQFPRTQAFFRDFISSCGSVAFLMQLQLALYLQLLRHNDSNFELQQLQPDEEDEGAVAEQVAAPYVVRPQAMAELLMLAKFLGYVYALPYNRSPATFVCPQQLQLRRQFQPPFEMHLHLERAMRSGKLLITLPWLVQYLIMLDLVTLQLPATLSTLELLYALYAEAQAIPQQPMQSCALFITRSCIGWLLESQPALSSGYYSQRTTTPSKATVELIKVCLQSLCFADKAGNVASLLELLLPVACPFLHEFRVAITPSQRQAQRNGRYRYITTRLEQLSSSGNSSSIQNQLQTETEGSINGSQTTVACPLEQQQRKLIDAFLHSQNASMRRLLEFVTERSFKCVVKDAQQKILLPSKLAADGQVNGISSSQQQEVLRDLQRIYQQALIQASQQWEEQVPAMLEKRIGQSLDALLPENTNQVLRRTYALLIRQRAQIQLKQWLQANVLHSTFYHGDLQEIAIKVCRVNKNNAQASTGIASASTNELCLTGELSLSELLNELQQWVHCLNMRPEHLCHMNDLQELLQRARQAALMPQLPTYFYQLLGSTLVRLLQLIISRQPQLFTENLISTSCDVWLSPHLHPKKPALDFVHSLLSAGFVQELSLNLASFQLLQRLLHAMLDTGVLHIDVLSQLFIPLFKENWQPPMWNALSQLLQQLSKTHEKTGGSGDAHIDEDEDGKSHLFMEMLADLSRDLDSF